MEVENMHVELEMLGEAFAVSGIKTYLNSSSHKHSLQDLNLVEWPMYHSLLLISWWQKLNSAEGFYQVWYLFV